jgi:hypothetical protein
MGKAMATLNRRVKKPLRKGYRVVAAITLVK